LEELDLEIHLVKEGQIISKEAKSQAKLIHGINLVLARNCSESLREEVKKGIREKATQGIYPGHAPFGYRNNKADSIVEVDPVDSPVVVRMMKLYVAGAHMLSTLRNMLKTDFGETMSRGNIHLILENCFYVGHLEWAGETYRGTHPLFIDPKKFARV
jgi:site-specific DNA recombinase